MRLRLRWIVACAVPVLALTTAAAGLGGPAGAEPSHAKFAAGRLWHGQFGTPSVLRVGRNYWAYSSATGGDNVPAMRSTDLRQWRARAAYPANSNPGWWSGYNDALPHPARWALYYIHRNHRSFTSVWSPDVARIGNRYVMTYAVSVRRASRHCISIATSARPDGPFVDTSRGPIVCAPDPNGSIDPQLMRATSGAYYLIWKNAGNRGRTPTKIWSRQLTASGTAFARGSRPHFLLATARRWEGNVIENPAMIRYRNRDYLFYSGNNYHSLRYATGYAICASVIGPCRRPRSGNPLMTTGRRVGGPGSASPFIGASGALHLAYAAWNMPHRSGSDPTHLHIATIKVQRNGRLTLAARG